MDRLPVLGLACALVACTAIILASSFALPPIVASHFGISGVANGWMPRGIYVAIILFAAVVLPLVVATSTSFAPRIGAVLLKLPNPDYWLAGPRRVATVGALRNFGCLLALCTSVFVTAVHVLVVFANAHPPPVLPLQPFALAAILFACAVLFLALSRRRRFRNLE